MVAALYTQNFNMRQLHQIQCNFLLDRSDVLQIDHFEIAAIDALANLFGTPPSLRLPIRVESLLHASAAVRAVCCFKTAAQTGVAVATVTIAVAGHPVND